MFFLFIVIVMETSHHFHDEGGAAAADAGGGIMRIEARRIFVTRTEVLSQRSSCFSHWPEARYLAGVLVALSEYSRVVKELRQGRGGQDTI